MIKRRERTSVSLSSVDRVFSSRALARELKTLNALPSIVVTHREAVELRLGRHGNARVRGLALMLERSRPVNGENVAR